MNDILPENVLKKTLNLAGKFDLFRLILTSAIYTAAALLIFVIMGRPLEWLHYVLIFMMMAAYSLGRAAIIRSRVKKALVSQSNYLLKARPEAELYIPMLEKPFGVIRLKKAALYLENGELWLMAYDLQIGQIYPKAGLSLPLGRDFKLVGITPGERPDFLRVDAKIKEQNYPFVIPAIDQLVSLIKNHLTSQEKEVN
ncbi:MAG: hypothetical protein WCR28_00680 [Candidatus Izemoplasmatales bacterium]|nr:hypothetical protein [Candidatus Izemoplasmatales bacterium]MDD4987332.1 hypothetical protein [Candidatus Izemoplasmatales bacterium]MDD5601602.1 hypothetical protein [Candidatus Izemoplasmatales bacterium]MDY0372894.1 hypothetical protein [Candidatus Izemoplasmatales bacterium]NLF48326.1 hypothetical protein [Acholeplasmataceae bacterium]